MNIDWVEDWFRRKVEVADSIVARYGESSTVDAEILLCCATSALAAKVWPGISKDKRRFIQFLVDFAPTSFKVTRISIPVLIAKTKLRERPEVAAELARHFSSMPQLEIVDGERIDQDEKTVLDTVGALTQRQVRDASYAGIIYSDLRSGLVHEYSLGPFVKNWRMSSREDVPSYVNMGIAPDHDVAEKFAAENHISLVDAEMALVKRQRHIYFPYPYLRGVLDGAARGAFEYWRIAADFEKSAPKSWWTS